MVVDEGRNSTGQCPRTFVIFDIYVTLPSRIDGALLFQYADNTTLKCSGSDPAATVSVME